MRQINVERTVEAPVDAVWAVLADFPNIADWNGGVKKSFSTNDQTDGVGATRHCDLSPAGGLEETVVEWNEGEKLVISIDSTSKLPFKSGLATFSFDETASATSVSVQYAYEPRFGPVGRLFGPLLDKQLSKGFTGFLSDLETTAQAKV